jgi:hypothetical protein
MSIAEGCANKDALVRAKVVDDVPLEDSRDALDLAKLVFRVIPA